MNRFQVVFPLIIMSLNYSVKLSRLMEYFLLMSNKCDSHVGELLSSESCDLKVQLIETLQIQFNEAGGSCIELTC
jgi:hypothetical protein